MTGKALAVGFGSHHADDQIGWRVAQELARRMPDIAVRVASKPLDILHWLSGISRFLICDGCRGSGLPGTVRRWTWPAISIRQFTWNGTHDWGIVETLSLADRLGCLPREVLLWTVETRYVSPSGPMSQEVEAAIPVVLGAMKAELANPTVDR